MNAFAKSMNAQVFKAITQTFAMNARASFANVIVLAGFAEAFFDVATRGLIHRPSPSSCPTKGATSSGSSMR